MKYLRQYIRQMLLTEAAMQPEDLPENAIVYIQTYGDGAYVTLEIDEKRVARVSGGPDLRRNGPCSGAWEVTHSRANDGWGPMLYDILMELAGSNGLMADRRSVSEDAYNVWNFYLSSRPDVKPKQLDIERPERFKGTITPDDETDDCVQDKYLNRYYLQSDINPKKDFINKADYLGSPITKAYVKSGPSTIDRLKVLGVLKDLR